MTPAKLRVVLATGNPHKLREVTEVLASPWLEVVPLGDFAGAGMPREGVKSLRDNALAKARAARDFTGMTSIGDDTGLEVDILGGAPGVSSSRYAGENASYDDNVRKLLGVLQSIPRHERSARFTCWIALAFPDGREKLFRGHCAGHITFVPRGTNGFGYDPIFVPDGRKSTFGQLSPALKNRLSHRGRALRSLKLYLRKTYREMYARQDSNLRPADSKSDALSS